MCPPLDPGQCNVRRLLDDVTEVSREDELALARADAYLNIHNAAALQEMKMTY